MGGKKAVKSSNENKKERPCSENEGGLVTRAFLVTATIAFLLVLLLLLPASAPSQMSQQKSRT